MCAKQKFYLFNCIISKLKELFAYGTGNVVSSFFNGFPGIDLFKQKNN
jgi:hypothetical protein